MFHPQAAKLFNSVSSKNAKGKGMSIFSFGGKVGFTLGPVYTAFSTKRKITLEGIKSDS